MCESIHLFFQNVMTFQRISFIFFKKKQTIFYQVYMTESKVLKSASLVFRKVERFMSEVPGYCLTSI